MTLVSAADLQIDMLLLSLRTPFGVSLFSWITVLADAAVVIPLTIAACFVLWRSVPLRAYAVGLAGAVAGAVVSSSVLKQLIVRARPDGLIPAIVETSSSFPSRHAALSMALYGFTAYLLCKLFPTKKPLIIAAAVLIIGTVGFSRLYLGVHFPSDVLAGYLLGGVWLVIGIRIAKMNITSKEV